MPAKPIGRQPGPLEISQVSLTQQELLGKDVDLDRFNLQMDSLFAVNLTEQILSANISRTIDGSSTLTVDVADPKHKFLRSGRLASRNMDIQIDGLWWRYVRCEKQGTVISMTFEDREIAVLRQYKNLLGPISRDQITRAEFIVKILNEVEEFVIPYYIPEIHKPQPVFNKQGVEEYPVGRDTQVSKHSNLTCKGVPATFDQINVVNAILTQGELSVPDNNPHKHKILVSAIMTATQESTLANLGLNPDGSGSRGAFQQIAKWGWPASGDVATDAAAYFTHAVAYDASHPDADLNQLCQGVQNSGFPLAYGQWRIEGERWVAASGKVPDNYYSDRKKQQKAYSNAQGGNFHYWRGIPPSTHNKKWQGEDSWTCIQRLADEVNWKAFFVGGTFYFMSEPELFHSQPPAVWSEDDDGIDAIDGDFDVNKVQATVSVRLRMGRYQVAPGTVVQLYDMGPFNGRWIAETIERSMFDANGSINLKKPAPAFAEPYQDELQGTKNAYDDNTPPDPWATTPGKQGKANVTKGPVNAIAAKILEYNNKRYFDDRGTEISQWRKVASGQKWLPCTGRYVSCDPKLAQAVLWIMDSGWQIGTYAICEDHNCDNPDSQHLIGQAIDIDSLGKVGGQRYFVNKSSPIAKQLIMEFMIMLRDLNPNQVICNGNGFEDKDIKNCQWSHGAPAFDITGDHLDHVHLGI